MRTYRIQPLLLSFVNVVFLAKTYGDLKNLTTSKSGLRPQIPLVDWNVTKDSEKISRTSTSFRDAELQPWMFTSANGNRGLLTLEDIDDHKSLYKFSKNYENCVSCSCGVRFTKRTSVDGIKLHSLEFPWIALLLYRNVFYCTTSLITNLFVVTSGHCTHNRDLPFISVRFFIDDSKATKSKILQRTIAMIYRPVEFDEITYNRDISLLKLSSPVPIFAGFIKPICLPIAGTSYGGLYGITVSLQKTIGDQPVFARRDKFRLAIQTNADCKKNAYGKTITPYMLCAGEVKRQNIQSCLYDRGSPLMVAKKNRFTLAGVASWGIQCAEIGYPAVFSRTTKFLGFITRIISDSCSCS